MCQCLERKKVNKKNNFVFQAKTNANAYAHAQKLSSYV